MDRLDGTSPKRARTDMADGPQPPKRRRILGIMPLEPRIMYDGAAAATTAAAASTQPTDAPAPDAAHDSAAAPPDSSTVTTAHASALQAPAVGAPATASPPASEIVFIDGNVPNLQDLVNGAKPGETVVVLDPAK